MLFLSVFAAQIFAWHTVAQRPLTLLGTVQGKLRGKRVQRRHAFVFRQTRMCDSAWLPNRSSVYSYISGMNTYSICGISALNPHSPVLTRLWANKLDSSDMQLERIRQSNFMRVSKARQKEKQSSEGRRESGPPCGCGCFMHHLRSRTVRVCILRCEVKKALLAMEQQSVEKKTNRIHTFHSTTNEINAWNSSEDMPTSKNWENKTLICWDLNKQC